MNKKAWSYGTFIGVEFPYVLLYLCQDFNHSQSFGEQKQGEKEAIYKVDLE